MNNEPRSSRLKDKKKSECETFVKQLFVQDVIHHNDLLYFLSNKSSAVVILPRNCVDNFSSSYNKLNAKKGLDSYSIGKRLPSDVDSQTKNNNNKVSNEGGGGGEVSPTDNRLSDQKLFSCVTCGILCFACVAIIQPTDTSARLFMSADRSFFSDSGIAGDGFKGVELEGGSQQETFSGHSGWTVNNNRDGLYEVPVQSSTDQIPATNQRLRPVSNNDVNNVSSSLNLLALNYGDSSDSEEELIEAEIPITEKNEVEIDGEEKRTFECRVEFETDSPVGSMPSNSSSWSRELPEVALSSSLRAHKNTVFPKSDEDSSRMHVFCLEHAVEVEQQLRQFGGSRLMLLCHPDYPKVEAEAKTVAEEVRTDYEWNDVPFRDATAGDEDKIRSALDGEEAMHGNGDWAVKLGINLYYSANLSRSPLYSKQMPYNFIIYAAFGRNSKPESHRKTPSGRQRKITVAGKWCGKVWMSNQVHPLLAERYPEDDEEEEEEIERESIDQNGKKSRKSIVESKSFRRARSPKEEEEENEINIETASINRTGKKRGKSTVESESFRRAKSPVEEEEEEDRIKDSGDRTPAPMSSFQQYYRRKPIKKEIVPLKVVNWGREPKEFINPPLLPSVAEEPEEGGPSTRLRKRTSKTPKQAEHKSVSKRPINPKPKKVPPAKVIMKNTRMNISEEEEEEEEEQEEEEHEHEQEEIYACEMEGCNMSFRSKQELLLHKRNICPVKGCGKKFFSHKYLVQHRRVHMDDRPLKCPWRGCKMTFKWAWARTEHIRVHTGARPYICTESGCGQTFRFVSDFSRHKRKTGHSRKKGKKG